MKSSVLHRLLATLLALIILNLLACGGAKQVMLLSQSDIATAEAEGTLFELYQNLESKKIEVRGSQLKELKMLQASIADRLTVQIQQQVNNALKGRQESTGVIDLITLRKLSNKINQLELINPSSYQQLNQQLAKATAKTNQTIQALKIEWESDAPGSQQALATLAKIAAITGEGSKESEVYHRARKNYIQNTAAQARTAYAERRFTNALDLAQKGLQVDPSNLVFESLSTQAKLEIFEQDFRSAMEQGKPKQAFNYLQEVADKPLIELIKRRMSSSMILLAKYFANSARLAYLNDQLHDAYTAFIKGRRIQQLLDRGDLGFPQEKMFLDKVMLKANSINDNLGVKYGLLMLVRQFDSGYPNLNQQLDKTLKMLSKRATTKIYISDFKEVSSNNSVIASVGRRVSKQLEIILFNKLGQQVQILSQPIVSSQDGRALSQLDGLLYTIQGDVLQSAIETNNHLGQRSINVITAIEKEPTEEYKKWSRRKRGDAPVHYKEREIKQEVTLKVTHIKKSAVLEISYQVVDPLSHKVILTKQLLKEQEFKGEAIAELKKGLYVQKYQAADLPSDIKIIDQLAKQVSSELGQSLVAYLAKPDELFYTKYEKNLEQGLSSRAIEFLANALVLTDKEEKQAWQQQLVNLALEN